MKKPHLLVNNRQHWLDIKLWSAPASSCRCNICQHLQSFPLGQRQPSDVHLLPLCLLCVCFFCFFLLLLKVRKHECLATRWWSLVWAAADKRSEVGGEEIKFNQSSLFKVKTAEFPPYTPSDWLEGKHTHTHRVKWAGRYHSFLFVSVPRCIVG